MVNVFRMTGPGMVGDRARSLIIEDNPGTRLALRTLLEDAGHAIDEAATGSEGVLAVHEGPPQADEIVILGLVLFASGWWASKAHSQQTCQVT